MQQFEMLGLAAVCAAVASAMAGQLNMTSAVRSEDMAKTIVYLLIIILLFALAGGLLITSIFYTGWNQQ